MKAASIETPAGYPSDQTVENYYDELDYQRACQAYLWALPFVSACGSLEGVQRDLGTTMQNVPIFEQGATPRQIILTANSQSIYQFGYLDLQQGPVVLEVPAACTGGLDNAWQFPLADIGPLGPDRGLGGKFLVLPPGHDAPVPNDYFGIASDTYWVMWLLRGAKEDGKAAPAVGQLKKTRIYPLAERDDPPAMTFINGSAAAGDLTFPTGFTYWETLHRGLQRERVRAQDKAMLGMLASLGIEKGEPFAPGPRMKLILERAAKSGLEMARVLTFRSRSVRAPAYKDRQWEWLFLADSATFDTSTHLELDARVAYMYGAEFISPAMVDKNVGVGSQCLAAYRDVHGDWLDGGRNYRLRLEPRVPAKDFWSLMAYDALTRSMVATDTNTAGVDSYGDLERNGDGSIDVYFGPDAPRFMESNWIKTPSDRGFFLYFRFYGPLEPFFDQTWKLNDVELAHEGSGLRAR